MEKIINPLFATADSKKVLAGKKKVTASAEIPAESEMVHCSIKTTDGKKIPVLVDFEERIVIPVKK